MISKKVSFDKKVSNTSLITNMLENIREYSYFFQKSVDRDKVLMKLIACLFQ